MTEKDNSQPVPENHILIPESDWKAFCQFFTIESQLQPPESGLYSACAKYSYVGAAEKFYKQLAKKYRPSRIKLRNSTWEQLNELANLSREKAQSKGLGAERIIRFLLKEIIFLRQEIRTRDDIIKGVHGFPPHPQNTVWNESNAIAMSEGEDNDEPTN